MKNVTVNIIKRKDEERIGLKRLKTLQVENFKHVEGEEAVYLLAGDKEIIIGNVWKTVVVYKNSRLAYEVYNVYCY